MSSTQTLFSRLKVLVAKAYRAEQLYQSIRNTNDGNVATVTALSEMANDIRAREWKGAHAKLRKGLNAIISEGNTSLLKGQVQDLALQFAATAEESNRILAHGIAALIENVHKGELARSLKLNAELIRHKAIMQACSAITDELKSVLEYSGSANIEEQLDKIISSAEEQIKTATNVIPFKKRKVA
jgi:hypothetical protein